MTVSIITPNDVASTWISSFKEAVESSNPSAVAATFLPNGWLRDILTFVWTTRSIRSPSAIASYLSKSDRLATAQITDVALSKDKDLRPAPSSASPGIPSGVEGGFDYETPTGIGKGYFRLLQDVDGVWRALTVFMMIWDFKGHEEYLGPRVDWETEDRVWPEKEKKRQEKLETDPYVLIIGGGHSGLTVAARCGQMDIPALVIDQHPRIGDSWRRRYQCLRFHNPKHHHQLLYQPFPSNWPTYTPRDMMADWLETYAVHQRIAHWTSTSIEGKPTYDSTSGKWTVVISRAGQKSQIHPAHIVVATGTLGPPYMPTLPNRNTFLGEVIHATQYVEPTPFKGKRVVIVGAANTAVDICEDLALNGAAEITMIQRGATCVVSRDSIKRMADSLWPLHVPVEVSDFKAASMPMGLIRETSIANQDAQWEAEKELHAKLRKAGVNLWLGDEGQGQLVIAAQRSGGFWYDHGTADLMASGRIKVKPGAEPTEFSSTGLVLSDGTSIEADTVIFATGYTTIRDTANAIFGDELMNKTGELTGMDDECEVNACYRPSGHPGLWFTPGQFSMARFMSKQLALQIKAVQIGLHKQ